MSFAGVQECTNTNVTKALLLLSINKCSYKAMPNLPLYSTPILYLPSEMAKNKQFYLVIFFNDSKNY